jgi:hypothetical protein
MTFYWDRIIFEVMDKLDTLCMTLAWIWAGVRLISLVLGFIERRISK